MSYITDFLANNYRHAQETERVYGIMPLITLSQAALESDWGRSKIAVTAKNFFGLTAGGPNAGTPHWRNGLTYKASTRLVFRSYSSSRDNFLDFGYFITHFSSYTGVRPYLRDFRKYADAISHTKYISEENGDDRAGYHQGLLTRAGQIAQAVGGSFSNLKVEQPKKATSLLLPVALGIAAGVLWKKAS
jgi:uncharacterized FlgJ-related protein